MGQGTKEEKKEVPITDPKYIKSGCFVLEAVVAVVGLKLELRIIDKRIGEGQILYQFVTLDKDKRAGSIVWFNVGHS